MNWRWIVLAGYVYCFYPFFVVGWVANLLLQPAKLYFLLGWYRADYDIDRWAE